MALDSTGHNTFAGAPWTAREDHAALADATLLAETQRARVFRFLFYSLRDREAAEELTQDVLLAAWRGRAGFRGDASLDTWVMRIAVNILRSHVRTGRFKFWRRAERVDVADLLAPPADPARSAEQTILLEEQMRSVWRAAGKLSERQRNVFLLHFVEEMDAREIAEAMGVPLSTVKTHLYRAIHAVRAAITEGRR